MFKSKSQRRKFYALKARGEMDQKTIDEWEKDTPKKIPERLTKQAAIRFRAHDVFEDLVFGKEAESVLPEMMTPDPGAPAKKNEPGETSQKIKGILEASERLNNLAAGIDPVRKVMEVTS
jgi:hypothetical protein